MWKTCAFEFLFIAIRRSLRCSPSGAPEVILHTRVRFEMTEDEKFKSDDISPSVSLQCFQSNFTTLWERKERFILTRIAINVTIYGRKQNSQK